MFLMCLIITWAHAIIYELLNQHIFRPSSHVKLRLAVMYIRNGSSMLDCWKRAVQIKEREECCAFVLDITHQPADCS